MLHILFLILKIIGIILLFLLGILVLALCAILFIPVKYELKSCTTSGLDNLSIRANATWFLKLFRAFVDYREKRFTWQVCLFWKRLNQDSDKDEEQKDNEEAENHIPVDEQSTSGQTEETLVSESKVSTSKKTKKTKKNKQNLFEKFKCTIKKICDKIKQAWYIKERIIDFLKEETHHEAYKILKKELKILFKHLKPKTLKGYLRFGMDDPYNTGQILALLSALYPFYGEKIQIYPDFENQVLEGDIHIKGRIHLITMVVVLLRLFFDKEIRKSYQDYKKIKSELIGGN